MLWKIIIGAIRALLGRFDREPLTMAEVDAALDDRASQLTARDDGVGSHLSFNHRQSAVDLMKVLGLDPGLKARCELAQDLGYTGELNGSAEMNTWLINEVRRRIAEGEIQV